MGQKKMNGYNPENKHLKELKRAGGMLLVMLGTAAIIYIMTLIY